MTKYPILVDNDRFYETFIWTAHYFLWLFHLFDHVCAFPHDWLQIRLLNSITYYFLLLFYRKSDGEKSPKKSPKKEEEKEIEQDKSPKKSPKESPKKSPKSSDEKPKLNPFAAMMGKSPASPNLSSSSNSNKYEDIVKKTRYDPIEDAIWKKDQKTPYLAFAKTLQAIEATSGRLRTIEILANYFRSVMVLSPDDLLPSVYMCLNRLAPAYEGKELGIGETLLIKAIAVTTGR